jgi:hypothetical protein
MSSGFELFDRVRILGNRLELEGAPAGTVGYVIERYADGALEVEVSNPATGETIAMVVATESELEHAPEPKA